MKKLLATLALSAVVMNVYGAYPDKSIKFLVPWPPGGATDQVARILVQPLTKELGVSVFVENKGGAGGNVPTMKEVGVSVVANAWYGVMLPAGAPKDVTEKLNAAFNKVLRDPEVKQHLQSIGAQIDGGSVADFTKFSQAEIKRYEGIVRMSGAPRE